MNGGKLILYMRLSREDGDASESQSISSQRLCLREFVLKSGLRGEIVEIADDGYSGTRFDRPGMRRLLEYVERGEVSAVIVRDLSRFARSYLEAGRCLEYLFPARGVRFISVNEGYDSGDGADASAGLHMAVRNLINQLYSSDISKKVKSAVDLKKLRGEYVYGSAPFGYVKGAEKNTIAVDAPAAAVVRRIFTEAAGGAGISGIARALNADGVATPSRYLSARRGGNYAVRDFWTYESVRNILQNRVYTGDTVPFRSRVTRVGGSSVRHIPVSEQTVLPDTHEAIIPRELFLLARAAVRGKAAPVRRGADGAPPVSLVCLCCGNRLQKSGAGYLCASARYDHESPCAAVRCSAEAVRQALSSCPPARRAEADGTSPRAPAGRSRNGAVQAEKMRLFEEYADGALDLERYFSRKAALDELERAAAAPSVPPEPQAAGRQRNTLTPELIGEIIEKIAVSPGGELKIILRRERR